jgi:predicted ATPase
LVERGLGAAPAQGGIAIVVVGSRQDTAGSDETGGAGGERWARSEIVRLKGEILRAQSASADAESCFRRAVEVAQRQGAKLLQLRAAVSLARLRQSQGSFREARELLTPLYDWFTEGFDTADLKDAKALLDQL